MGGNGFSSLKNFDTLKEAGFNESQARAILEMMSQDSASKQDLKYATAELKRDIANIERDIKELNNKIEITKTVLESKIETTKTDLKNDFFNKMAWFSLATITVLGALMNYLKFFAD